MASSRQVACRVALGLSLLGPTITLANAQEPTPATDVVDQYRRARARTMEAGATEADVTLATALLADSVLYEHPAAGRQHPRRPPDHGPRGRGGRGASELRGAPQQRMEPDRPDPGDRL